LLFSYGCESRFLPSGKIANCKFLERRLGKYLYLDVRGMKQLNNIIEYYITWNILSIRHDRFSICSLMHEINYWIRLHDVVLD
jgi:hypothetical protein